MRSVDSSLSRAALALPAAVLLLIALPVVLSARIILPTPVSASDLAFEADTGGAVPVSVTPTDHGLSVEAVDLPAHTRLWVAVGFPKDLAYYRWTPRWWISRGGALR